MNTACNFDSFTTAEERALDLLRNAFGGDVVMQGSVVSPGLREGLADALRVIAAEERFGV